MSQNPTRTRPHFSRGKIGEWRFTLPNGEELHFTGPSGGYFTIIRECVRYVLLLSFNLEGDPVVVCNRKISLPAVWQDPTPEQDGLRRPIWVPCFSREEGENEIEPIRKKRKQ
jgi:hypothetical protein